jgi:hypothetical protein
MNKFLGLYCVLILFISCVTPPVSTNIDAGNNIQNTEKYIFSVDINNPTIFNISIDNQIVEKNKDKTVELPVYENELSAGFDITYEIPLSESVSLFCKGDKQTIRKEQSAMKINAPLLNEDYGCYVKITNKANNSVAFINGNSRIPILEQRGNYVIAGSRYEFSPNETAVYKIDDDFISNNYAIRDGRKDNSLIIPEIRQNYLYQYEYGADGLVMIDARPLHRTGEPGWAKTVADANYPLTLVQGGEAAGTTDNAILFLASTENGTALYSLPQNGTAWDVHTREDTSVDTTVLVRTKDERFLLIGYQYNGDTYIPFAQKQSADGNVQWLLAPSTRQDSRSAYFTAVAQKDADTWLVAGGADTGVNSSGAYRAYIREIRDTGTGVESVWELGPGDFDPRCGAVKSAVYDAQNKVWYVAGELLSEDNGIGTYICVVENGKIIGADTSLEHFSFSKICVGNNGYYLVGEEQKPNGEVYAVLLHYDANGNRIWQQATQLKSYSYYQDALVDSENKQLVLAGTMGAITDRGKGGMPFIQGVDPENGTQLWLQELNDPAFEKASLVYQMIKAPDYGYILSLTGMADDFYAKPFVVARVNARGRLIK